MSKYVDLSLVCIVNGESKGDLMDIKTSAKEWLLKNPKFNPFKLRYLGMWRILSSPFRILPDFLIIGAAKCGTTSLYDYIIQHPNVLAAKEKEPGFFAVNYKMGMSWYKAHFPTYLKKFRQSLDGRRVLTGEASTVYLLHPESPKRLKKQLPNVKLIVLLRNPVDRAFSNYHFQVKKNREKRSFTEAIKNELSEFNQKKYNKLDLDNEIKKAAYSYVKPGIYVDQLKNWFNYFKKEDFLILETESFDKDPQETLNQVFKFLDLQSYSLVDLKRQNVGKYKKMDPDLRLSLIEFFKPHNDRLFNLLGKNFEWNK